jgi:hypothetical protein
LLTLECAGRCLNWSQVNAKFKQASLVSQAWVFQHNAHTLSTNVVIRLRLHKIECIKEFDSGLAHFRHVPDTLGEV